MVFVRTSCFPIFGRFCPRMNGESQYVFTRFRVANVCCSTVGARFDISYPVAQVWLRELLRVFKV